VAEPLYLWFSRKILPEVIMNTIATTRSTVLGVVGEAAAL